MRTRKRAMSADRVRTIGTVGGCGEVARRLLARVGGVPCLRYDCGGVATHAAVKVDGRFVHLGEDDDLTEVSVEEFERACREDFDPDHAGATDAEFDWIADQLAADCR